MSLLSKKKSDIIKDVKVILDQNETDEPLILEGDVDQLTNDEIIEHMLEGALKRVYGMAPSGMLIDDGKNLDDIEWDMSDKYAQTAKLPDSFDRIVYVKLKGWERGVTSIIEEEDPLYAECRSPYAGIRPTKDEPAAALVYDELDSMRIEAYPKTGLEGVVKYIGSDVSADGDELAIGEMIYQGFLYTTAYLYYTTLGQSDMADMMNKEAMNALHLTDEEK